MLVAGPAAAFDPSTLESVVSVLPDWPADKPLPERPEGSGVAVMAGGYIATNGHVLGAATTLRVRLADGRILAAEIVGVDRLTDIALIKAPVELPLRETAPPPLGATVCVVGNPFGLGLSVSCGVVSAVHRTGTGFNPIEDFIQTDATVNPGASGGALLDADGRLVGLVSAIFTKGADADIGVNFAASAELLMRVVEDLARHGRVIRAKTGLRVADLDEAHRATLVGARVTRVDPGGSADAAGLAAGDLITAIGERAIRRASDVTSALHMHRPGDRVAVSYLRGETRHTADFELRP
jgi:S1-C subfamily serine protease